MVFGKRGRQRKTVTSGLETIPPGAQMIPITVKDEYDPIPFHVYHPNPFDAITILRGKKDQHGWLVCGWYIDTYREGGSVKGLLYRMVASDQDKEFVQSELKKHDKEASPRFKLQ